MYNKKKFGAQHRYPMQTNESLKLKYDITTRRVDKIMILYMILVRHIFRPTREKEREVMCLTYDQEQSAGVRPTILFSWF